MPICAKNSSWPAGAQMQSNRTVALDALVKECGALAGMLTVWPACTIDFSPRKVDSISPSRIGGGRRDRFLILRTISTRKKVSAAEQQRRAE